VNPRGSAPGISFSAKTRRRILLIEDEESIAEPLAAALAREGFDVTTAATASAGVDAFRTDPPDAVLLDVMLPDSGSGGGHGSDD
jgi:DNA-binding response OmpR family regulator